MSSLSLMSSLCRSGWCPTTWVPAPCVCHPWLLWGAAVGSPTYDLHRGSSGTQMGALEHEPSTVKSMPVSCISLPTPWPPATVVNSLWQWVRVRTYSWNLNPSLIRRKDNGLAQFYTLMTSFFLAQCNEGKKCENKWLWPSSLSALCWMLGWDPGL